MDRTYFGRGNTIAQTTYQKLMIPSIFVSYEQITSNVPLWFLKPFIDIRHQFPHCATWMATISIAVWQLNQGDVIDDILPWNILIRIWFFILEYFKLCFGLYGYFTLLLTMSATNVKLDFIMLIYLISTYIKDTTLSSVCESPMATRY